MSKLQWARKCGFTAERFTKVASPVHISARVCWWDPKQSQNSSLRLSVNFLHQTVYVIKNTGWYTAASLLFLSMSSIKAIVSSYQHHCVLFQNDNWNLKSSKWSRASIIEVQRIISPPRLQQLWSAFSVRVVTYWNKLPVSVVTVPPVNITFKKRMEKVWTEVFPHLPNSLLRPTCKTPINSYHL